MTATRPPASVWTRWRIVLLTALTVVLGLLLPAAAASERMPSAAETRVGAISPAVTVSVGVHECITAGQRPVRGPSQLQVVSGRCVAAKAIPRGFSGADEFGQFGTQLHGGLSKAGFSDTRAAFQGSSVTGRSFHTGAPFDVGRRSDFDVALAGEDIFSAAQSAGIGLRSRGTRTGPLGAVDLEQLGLTGLRADLSDLAARDVNFMIFRNLEDAFGRSPSIGVLGP